MPQQSPLTPALDRARALIASGDLDPAQVLLERAVELGRENLGEDDPDVLTAQRELAGVYLLIDDPMGARRVLEDAYAAGQWRLGDGDPVLLHISHDLGVVAQELGNRHEARKAFGRVAEHGPAALGDGHELVTQARAYLGDDPATPTVRPETPSPRLPADPPVPSVQQPAPVARPAPLVDQPPPVVPPANVVPPPVVPPANVVPPPAVVPQTHGDRPDTRAAMEQPTDVFPVARPTPAPPVDGGTAVSPHATAADGPVGNPWTGAPHPPAIPEQRQSTERQPGFPERRQEAAHQPGVQQRQGSAEQRQEHGQPQPLHRQTPQAYEQTQHGYGQVRHGYDHAQQGYDQAQHGYGQAQRGHGPQTEHPGYGVQPGPLDQAGYSGYPEERQQPGPAHPGTGAGAGTDRPAVWPQQPVAHPGWQGPLPGVVGAGHPYPGERVDERPPRGRGLAVGLTVVATLMAVIAVGALVVVLVQREQQPLVAPQVTVPVTATGPVLAGDPPTEVKLTDRGTVVTVTWSDPTAGKVPFVVMMAQEGQQLKPAANVGLKKTASRVTGLNPALQYCFTVVAVYATDRYATSNQVCTQRN